MNCIGNKVDLGCFGNCDAIATGLVATQSGVHYVVYRFSGQINTGSFEAVVDEEMIIPNMFNDYGASTFSIENPDGSLFVKTVDNEDYTIFQVRINPANNQAPTVFASVSDNPFTDAEKTKLEGLGAVTLFSDTESFTGTYYGADPVYVRTFNVTSADFASTIYTTNLLKASVKLLLNWDYNVKSGSGTIIYDKFGGVAPQVVFGGFATYVTISNLVNSATVSYLFTLYYTKN